MAAPPEGFSVAFRFITFLRSLKPVDMTLSIFTTYLGMLVAAIITTVIMGGEIKVSTGERERQQVSGSLDHKSCHLIHNPEPQPLNLAFCDMVKHTSRATINL